MIRASCQSLLLVLAAAVVFSPSRADAGSADKRLDLYFIDVEGGAATLIVTPAGESILIDSGYPDNQGRDLNRILHVVRDVAGLKGINHAAVTHWHRDHYGNHAALAAEIKIGDFYDRGIPDVLPEDPEFTTRIADYRRASQNQSRTLRAGDDFDLESPSAPLNIRVITADRQVVANTGKPNPFADRHQPQPEDTTDNAASLSLLFTFGKFKFLCCGDLTWNVEAQIVTPNNPIGQVDLFMVTHHGLEVSNNPALVLAIDPVVAVMCNGPTKGGHANTQTTLREVKSLKALYQLHRNLSLADDQQTPAEFIANSGDTAGCEGVWVKASVAPDGKSYTVQIGEDGAPATYATRQ
jgi:competence protein ComEC